jgi:hypothetical protein
MIQYAFLDDVEEVMHPPRTIQVPTTTKPASECNTLVAVFIGGVVLLAVLDTIR